MSASMDDASRVLVGSIEGTSLSRSELDFFKEEAPSGITLFSRNIDQQNLKQLKDLILELNLAANASQALIIAIDQEGGRVKRLNDHFPDQGPALELCQGKSDVNALEQISKYGAQIGQELGALGININFAPVLDIWEAKTNIAIGDRCFGSNPEAVTKRSAAFISGMQSKGVFGCLKHFPGQGAATIDTHQSCASIDKSLAELLNYELIPFQKVLPQAELVMVSHCIYPKIASCEATRSRTMVTDILKERLAYKGIVVSDDMTMGAMDNEQDWVDNILQAISAGVEMILICSSLSKWQKALEAIRKEAASCPAFKKKLKAASEKITAFRDKLSKPASGS